ncbi:MAG: YggS family pyridoxal phosphate-dependent enzyme, partial [Betaproteobacteria bacterium]|nr:YggS family pyridoxal phosphate-dependent enzyme [Betaproteobacteria bacterium]
MSRIESNLQAVRQRIEQACRTSARPVAGVQLLAVSKTFGAEAVLQAIAAGQRAFGENYVQEGVDKLQAVVQALGPAARSSLQWHLIGPIQSNKTRPIAEHFDWVHTIDRLKVAERLSAQRPAQLPALQVCVQVNVSGEASKSGVAPADTLALAQAVARLPRLALRGV